MSHYHANTDFGATQNSAYVAAALEAKANLRKEAALQKRAQAQKNNGMAQQPMHQPRASAPAMTINQQQLALQQGQLIMNTQLHQHRLRGQYFSAYEQKPWYCDCAGTNIGCAGGTVKGDFQFRDLAYWKCELDSRGLSKCGVTFCNACVIRDEQLSKSPRASGTMNPQHFQMNSMNSVGSSNGGMSVPLQNNNNLRNNNGNASTSSQNSNMSPNELAAMQAMNDKKGKKRSSKMGAKVYTEPNVVKRGWMLKRGNIVKNWKRRYFVLREDRQLYYYSNDKTSSVKGVAQFFEVEQIVKHDKQIFSVHLKGGRTWHFSCANQDDRDDWCTKLKLLCKAPIMIAKAKGANNDDNKKD